MIPIVFAAAGDPVGTGLVGSLARPGHNVTGLSNQQTDLAGNQLQLLGEVVPGLRRVAVMGNVDTPNVPLEMDEVRAAAAKLGLEVSAVAIRKMEDIVPGIEALKGRVDGLYVCTDPLITAHRIRINTFALSEKLPTMYAFREYVQAGGLMSYGPNFPDLFRRAGDFVDKILGTKPGDIPVEQPVKLDLIHQFDHRQGARPPRFRNHFWSVPKRSLSDVAFSAWSFQPHPRFAYDRLPPPRLVGENGAKLLHAEWARLHTEFCDGSLRVGRP